MIFIFSVFSACKKEKKEYLYTVKLMPTYGGNPIELNVYNYVTTQNDTFKITNLEMYVSDFKINGKALIESKENYLAHTAAQSNATSVDFKLEEAIPESYTFEWYHGFSPQQNVPNGIINNSFNNAMQWPDVLGGGYHFMKFEGRFLENGIEKAFAIHLGKNGNQVVFSKEISNNVAFIEFELDSLLKSKHSIDLKSLPGSIMENDSIQTLFKENVQKSVRIL
jgi:hypothetical protein